MATKRTTAHTRRAPQRRLRHVTGIAAAAAFLLSALAAGTSGPANADPVPPAQAPSSTRTVAPTTVAKTAPPCADVTVLGARGSGETMNSGDFLGFGPRASDFLGDLQTDLGSTRVVAQHALSEADYPALPVTKLGSLKIGPSNPFFKGIDQGVVAGAKYLRSEGARCPDEQFVLTGYSQGAMVLHRILAKLDTGTPADNDLLNRIAGVALLADGDRHRNEGTHLLGLPAAGASGIGVAALFGQRDHIPDQLDDRTWQICTKNDLVCDIRLSPADLKLFPYVNLRIHVIIINGTRIHLSNDYKNRSPLNATAATAIADEVRRTPAMDRSSLSVRSLVNQPVDRQLVADIDPDFTLDWRVAPGHELPAGLTLGADGRLAGTPTATGTATTPIQVRGTILGVSTRWVGGDLTTLIATPSPTPTPGEWDLGTLTLPDAPAGSTSSTTQTLAAGCTSDHECTALSATTSYTDGHPTSQFLLWSDDGSGWDAPVVAATHPTAPPFGGRWSLDCGDTTCVAAIPGNYTLRDDDLDDDTWTFTGGSWQHLTLPLISNWNSYTGHRSVDAVVCGGPTCVVAGSFTGTPADPHAHTAAFWSWNGTTWAAQAPQAPKVTHPFEAYANPTPQQADCDPAGHCVVTGTYNDFAQQPGTGIPAAAIWDYRAGTWTAQAPPLPPHSTGTSSTGLVTCTSTSCAVSGGTAASSSLLWTEPAGSSTWQLHAAPTPAGANSYISQLACTAGTLCLAVQTGNNDVRLLRFDGTTWSEDTLATSAGPVATLAVSHLGCTDSGPCALTGRDTSASPFAPDTLWTGPDTWTPVDLPIPLNEVRWSAIGCGATACTVTGAGTTGHPAVLGLLTSGGFAASEPPQPPDATYTASTPTCGDTDCLAIGIPYSTEVTAHTLGSWRTAAQ